MTTWQETGGTGRAYSDWEAAQAGSAAAGQIVPVFLELSLDRSEDASDDGSRQARQRTRQMRQAGLWLAPHEADRLVTELMAVIAAGQIETWRFRLVAYARRGDVAALETALPFLKVLHIGAPLPVDATSALPDPAPVDRTPRSANLLPPIAAIIDDGIPYLGARFRRGLTQTRILSVWLQTDQAVARPGTEEVGRVLSRAEIEADLLPRPDEAQVYRDVNAGLVPITERASTNFAVSHGAHVLDIAAGAEPDDSGDAMGGLDLLAVQLPSTSVADTSGRLMARNVVQGLRWSILQTLTANQDNGAGALVANLSLGALAGPGDHTGFLAGWLDYEVAAYRLITGCDLRVVCAYGNSHRDKLSARAVVTDAAPMAFDWVVQPEDYTPSFLELRVAEAEANTLSIAITPPQGGPDPVTMTWAEAAKGWTWDGHDGRPGAAILPLDEASGDGRTTAILLATAATAHPRGLPAAASGIWQITVSGGPALVTANVQRDDSPAGYRILGRQSWLDGLNGYTWDNQTLDWIRPGEPYGQAAGASGPVTRLGTAVAHAGATAETVNFVAAIKTRIGFPDQRVATIYSASGLPADMQIDGRAAWRDGESEGPDLGALASDGSNLWGRNAGGVISGSIARLSGTSVAAPAVTRAWMLAYLAQQEAGATRPQPTPPLSTILANPPEPRHPIMGVGYVHGQAPYERGSEMQVPPDALTV